MKKYVIRFVLTGIALSAFWIPVPVWATTVEYELTIGRQEIDITGRPTEGMTINGTIPGPVLRFTEGDQARIRVTNTMAADTSIHWHGLLVPPGMDGVPYVSFPPIKPGATFTYEFPIRQSGTYWYHSHSALQEQSGVYGGIVIEPRTPRKNETLDQVVLLSDWIDEDPHSVLRTLKRGSEWYALQKGSIQSIAGAARLGMLGDYYKRELQRMPAMDLADVAYDRFLANGKSEIDFAAAPGKILRLRIIDGAATTFFHLQFAGGPMTIVAADGQDVEPVQQDIFLIGVAETYDVLIRLPAKGAYELRATAHDGSGRTSIWIGSGKRHYASDIPKPNLYKAMGRLNARQVFALTPAGAMGMSDSRVAAGDFDRPGMMGMGGMDMDHMHMSPEGRMNHKADDMTAVSGMDMQGMPAMDHGNAHKPGRTAHEIKEHPANAMSEAATGDHPAETHGKPPGTGKPFASNFGLMAADVSSAENLAVDGLDASRPWPPYDKLRATRSTAFSESRPIRNIRLTLDGDMHRYVWMLNNKTLSESDDILIRKGEITRFIMINRTMMHHTMHLHGQFFRVINGQGDHAPLKHTVDVAPMSTTVIEFDANEVGDWFFHCHLLYHMKAGMARVVHYREYSMDPDTADVRSNVYKDPWYFWGEADIMSHMTEGGLTLSNTRNILMARWEGGWQGVDDPEWEGMVTWDRYVNRFFSFFGGFDFGDGIEEDRGIAGIRYVLPLNLETTLFAGTDGGGRIVLEKHFELTPRIALAGHVQYDTDEKWEGSAGISYTLTKMLDIVGNWHSDFGVGAGLHLKF